MHPKTYLASAPSRKLPLDWDRRMGRQLVSGENSQVTEAFLLVVEVMTDEAKKSIKSQVELNLYLSSHVVSKAMRSITIPNRPNSSPP